MKIKSRLQCSDTTFIICVSLFITLFQNTRFLTKGWDIVGFDSLRALLFSASMVVLLFCCLNVIFSLLLLPYLRKSVAIIFILTGAVINYFMYSFNIVIDANMTDNALQTNLNETLDLVSIKMVLWIVCLGIIPSIIVAITQITPTQSIKKFITFKAINIIASTLAIVFIAFFFYRDYAPFFRNNKDMMKMLVPSNAVASLIKNISDGIEARKPFETIGLDAKKGEKITGQPKKTLVILVLGETARAENFSLGGYQRDTNPLLSKRSNLTYFDNVSSCGTATAVSLPCMFSNMTRKDYSAIEAKHQENVLDILQRANVSVLWRDNDSGCKGACDRVPNQNSTRLMLPEFCSDGACKDEVLLDKLDDYIQKLDNDGIIILHQMGSHGPTYYQRYPAAQRKFDPTCDTKQIQDCDKVKLVNTYDNSIVYTDYILDKTISLLEKNSDKFATSMIYVSDHGESLGENGMYLHGAPYAIAPSQQTHVPMMIWTSDDYRNSQKLNQDCLSKEAKQNTFSHDNLFHSLLGIFDIQTNQYKPELDMFRSCRQ